MPSCNRLYRSKLEDMVRQKLDYVEGSTVQERFETFMKLAGPYWMSCVMPDDTFPILPPDHYLTYRDSKAQMLEARQHMSTITHLPHFLTEKGSVPADLPGPARRLVAFLGEIVKAISDEYSPDEIIQTNVPCRRRPNRKPCVGLLNGAMRGDNGQIEWRCPACGDNGVITGWEGTIWDVSGLLGSDGDMH